MEKSTLNQIKTKANQFPNQAVTPILNWLQKHRETCNKQRRNYTYIKRYNTKWQKEENPFHLKPDPQKLSQNTAEIKLGNTCKGWGVFWADPVWVETASFSVETADMVGTKDGLPLLPLSLPLLTLSPWILRKCFEKESSSDCLKRIPGNVQVHWTCMTIGSSLLF